jgi:hypothetical protein
MLLEWRFLPDSFASPRMLYWDVYVCCFTERMNKPLGEFEEWLEDDSLGYCCWRWHSRLLFSLEGPANWGCCG